MTSDGIGGDAQGFRGAGEPDHPDHPGYPEAPDGANARVLAPTVEAITNVIALVGPDLEPQRCHIYIHDGVIAAIVAAVADTGPPAAAPPPQRDPYERSKPVTIDGKDMIAIPGLVDVHARMRPRDLGLPALGLPASAESLAAGARMGPEQYGAAALLGSLRRLKRGITTVVEHAYPFDAPGLDEVCINGYESSGIRWAYARGIMTRPGASAHKTGETGETFETFEQAANNIRRLLASTNVTPDRLFVAPVGIVHATLDDFARAAALAAELGAGTYACVAATPAERGIWRREARAEPVVALDRAGFLTDRTVLVHGVFLGDDELGVLAARAASIVRCPATGLPATGMRPATGTAGSASDSGDASQPIQAGKPSVADLLAAGVNVALGAGLVPDLFPAMRAELHRRSPDSGGSAVLSPRDVLRMATGQGAAAAFLDSAAPFDLSDPDDPAARAPRVRIGELSAGLAADIVLIPASALLEAGGLSEAPQADPLHALVHHGRGSMARDVLVEGQLVVSDGVSTLVDEHELLIEAEWARDLWRDLPAGPGGVWFPPSPPQGW